MSSGTDPSEVSQSSVIKGRGAHEREGRRLKIGGDLWDVYDYCVALKGKIPFVRWEERGKKIAFSFDRMMKSNFVIILVINLVTMSLSWRKAWKPVNN